MYKRDIYLDIDDKLNEHIKSVELDSNSRVWHFHLMVDYEPLDLTGKSVHFRAEKPDKTNVLNDCKIVDAEKGVVEVKLTRQVNAIPGCVKCLLKIIGDEGFVLKTKTFVVDVSKTLSDDAIVSSDEFGALEAALGKVQDIDNRFAQTNAQLSEKVGKNEISINIKYPPAPLVAVVDGADNTSTIQAIIDYVWKNGGGEIIIPKGTHRVSTLVLRDRVSLVGTGRYSIIKSIDNNNAIAIVQMYGKSAINTCIKNLSIDGNKENQTNAIDGILIDNSLAKNDAHHLIDNVYIHSCSGNGLSIPTQSRENRFINVWCEKNKLNGFYICGTDNFMAFCTSNFNDQNGYYFLNSYSNKINTSKAFGNYEHGFKFESSGSLQLTSLESQENYKNGYYFINSQNIVGGTLISDTNSTEGTKSFHGVVLENSTRHHLSGLISNAYNLLNDGHGYAVVIKGNSKFNYLNFTKYGSQKPMKNCYEEFKDISNAIFINNFVFSLANMQKSLMVDDENQDNISDCFDSIVIHPTAITGDYSINHKYQSQKLEITSSTNAGDWASIYAIKKIGIYENQSLSTLCCISLTNETGTKCKLSVEWFNENDQKIGENVIYNGNEMVLFINEKAPVGTNYANIKIIFYPVSVGQTGSMHIHSFKYGKY